jgi:hypothetical protein
MCAFVIMAPRVLARDAVTQAGNILTNGDFEQGFVFDPACGGLVGSGWLCFHNSGITNYGFYDDEWPPVVFKSQHSQLIEINTKSMALADNDRYAGIYQTVRVEPGTTYTFHLRGMIRVEAVDDGRRDPFRYRVQFGWSFAPTPDWRDVESWVDMGWNRYQPRLFPGRFEEYTAKIVAQEPNLTVFLRVWKKWGDVGEEIDVNLDNISLRPAPFDATVLPTLTSTPIPPDAPQPLRLAGGTPVARLPTPPSVYGQLYVPPTELAQTTGWPRLYGKRVSFAYPSTWEPLPSELAGIAIVEEFRLGIPYVLSEQSLGFLDIPFGDLNPPDKVLTSRFMVGDKEGVKWLRQGPNYVIYEYCTSGVDNQGSFCVRVNAPASSPMLELQLDRLVQSIEFY